MVSPGHGKLFNVVHEMSLTLGMARITQLYKSIHYYDIGPILGTKHYYIIIFIAVN